MVVTAVHQIAVHIYSLDEGRYKHRLHGEWREGQLPSTNNGRHSRGFMLPYTAFVQREFHDPDRYPHGLADAAAYWLEGEIFGGVMLFDRGQSDTDCKAIWMQGHRIHGACTLYPPTTVQLDALIRFLLNDTGVLANTPCPLPILATAENRPRWDTLDAFTDHHIFRNRYEREPKSPLISQEAPNRFWCRRGPSMLDWPECEDE
ncbi:uncharacterized protein F5Z01DRAFT_642277 [Emericellopsis atlantica]|uniref:Uncharacterized protein n=1 Tax=Emericellopsis atlantica TaxID=2614577 RepID=A0A9P7ZWW2_9HYPO|nr:uncharacterized protein F5Z01DRAFT_642277 [Emericellopsis atlantica]KAG9259086.1 hypothetical protein F5Z01DRAFT_642277 [Emericellopsis atlantica]